MKGDFQFNFPLAVNPAQLLDHPEWFRVPFIGAARDWPNPEAAQAIADQTCEGNLDTLLAFIVSGQIGLANEKTGGTDIAAFALPIRISLADPNVGVIQPRAYTNMEIVAEETEKFNSR